MGRNRRQEPDFDLEGAWESASGILDRIVESLNDDEQVRLVEQARADEEQQPAPGEFMNSFIRNRGVVVDGQEGDEDDDGS